MQKIWAKTITDHRVKKSIIHDCGEKVDLANFYNNVRKICEKLKIPTPVVLNTYAQGFLEFNIVKFRQRDFVEEVLFDALVLEAVVED